MGSFYNKPSPKREGDKQGEGGRRWWGNLKHTNSVIKKKSVIGETSGGIYAKCPKMQNIPAQFSSPFTSSQSKD